MSILLLMLLFFVCNTGYSKSPGFWISSKWKSPRKKKKSLFGWTVYVRPQQWWLVTQKIGEDRRKTNMESYNCFQKQKSLSGEKAASLKTFSINILFLNKEVLILSLEWFWMCHFIYKVKFRFIVLFYCDNRFMFSSNRQHITWFTPVSCVFS